MFEENYRREMQAALPSAAATDALERRMDALRRRPKRPPVREVAVVLLALLLLAVPLLPALLQPQTQGYEALLAKLEGMSGYRALSPNDFLFSSDSVMEVEPPASEEPSDGAESGNAAYSETNNQVAGVQEPDTVKTDGRFLYSLSAGENVLHITRADNGVLSAAASIDPVGDSAVVAEIREQLLEFADGTAGRRDASLFRCTEFLLGGNRLTLLLTVPAQWYLSLLPDLPDYGYYNILGHSTLAMVYDVADPAAPTLVNEFLFSGSYGTARQIGGQVFVMTGERAVRSENVYELLPSCRVGGKMLYPDGGDICIAADAANPYFTSVSVLDTSGRARCTDIKTFLGFSSQLYMNAESLYLSGARYDGGTKTQLVRFRRTGDGLEFAAEGCVPGSLLNQFSMDEYDGVLRVAVTETNRNGESTNSLYTCGRRAVRSSSPAR
ncbi:MAG: beta-propeller domain-containing protein [Acutalibacteraceae bacterium]